MKSILFMLGVTLFLFSSCSNDLDSPLSLSTSQDKTPLNVHVVSVPTKAEVSSNLLPNNSELGVFLTKSDGNTYKSEIPYNNIKYTGTGNPYASTWTVDQETPVYLYADKATAYAYYPRQESGVSLTSIPITNDGTDWMYSLPVENLYWDNSTANFTMQHAMSIIRINIERLTAADHGTVSNVSIVGDGYATGGIINLVTGTIGNFTGVGSQLSKSNVGTIGENAVTCDHWVVPNSNVKDIKLLITIDHQVYRSLLSNVTLQPGKIYNINLKFTNSIGLLINSVSVSDWEETNSGEMGMIKSINTWEEAKIMGGVYGIMSNGKPLDYHSVLISNEKPNGVAFVVKGKAYQVAKVDATGYDGSASVYWQKDNYTNIPGPTDYTTSDGTNWDGYLAGTGGTQLSREPSTWINGAVSDFNGQVNTATILVAQNNGADDYTIGKAVMEFRNGSKNEGQVDWFVPSCGELAYMFLKRTELNTLLDKVRGKKITNNYIYWSSTDSIDDLMWTVSFYSGNVGRATNKGSFHVRLIREI